MDRNRIRSEILALTMLLAQINDPNINKPMFPAGKSSIWLARETGLSRLDPVEVALESMASVQVKNRLPSPEEAKGVKAIVIEAQDASMGAFTPPNIAAINAGLKKPIPMLWLVHQCEMSIKPADENALKPTPMPAPLETLAKFLEAAA
jgi:hypothetical protein